MARRRASRLNRGRHRLAGGLPLVHLDEGDSPESLFGRVEDDRGSTMRVVLDTNVFISGTFLAGIKAPLDDWLIPGDGEFIPSWIQGSVLDSTNGA